MVSYDAKSAAVSSTLNGRLGLEQFDTAPQYFDGRRWGRRDKIFV